MKAVVDIKKLNDLAKLPTRGSEDAAGYDLYAATEYETKIPPHSTAIIDTGLAAAFPSGTYGAIFPRSGIASKRGLRLANCVAVIDADYRGSIMIPLHNDTEKVQVVQPQERIAQLILMDFNEMVFNEVT